MGIPIGAYLCLDIDTMGRIPGAGAKWTMATNGDDRARREGRWVRARDATRLEPLKMVLFFHNFFSLLNNNLDYAPTERQG